MEIKYTCQCEGTIASDGHKQYQCLNCRSHFRELPAIYCFAKGVPGRSPAVGFQVFPEVKGDSDAERVQW